MRIQSVEEFFEATVVGHINTSSKVSKGLQSLEMFCKRSQISKPQSDYFDLFHNQSSVRGLIASEATSPGNTSHVSFLFYFGEDIIKKSSVFCKSGSE